MPGDIFRIISRKNPARLCREIHREVSEVIYGILRKFSGGIPRRISYEI